MIWRMALEKTPARTVKVFITNFDRFCLLCPNVSNGEFVYINAGNLKDGDGLISNECINKKLFIL